MILKVRRNRTHPEDLACRHGSVLPGRSVGEFEVISPGAEGTGHALQFKGRVESGSGFDHGYVAARYPFNLPAGATNLRGIQIEVRGISRLFQVRSSRRIRPCLPPRYIYS